MIKKIKDCSCMKIRRDYEISKGNDICSNCGGIL